MIDFPDDGWFTIATKPMDSSSPWQVTPEYKQFLNLRGSGRLFDIKLLKEIRDEEMFGTIFMCTVRNKPNFDLKVKRRHDENDDYVRKLRRQWG